MVRMTEAQVRNLVAGIECPTRVIYADPPQPYLPEPLRSEHVRLLPDGELVVLPGGHHLHMEDPAAVAAAIRSEEHTSELQSLMRISYAVFCLIKNIIHKHTCIHTYVSLKQRSINYSKSI